MAPPATLLVALCVVGIVAMAADTAAGLQMGTTTTVLKQLVPLLYLIMALFLGVSGKKGRLIWVYIVGLGSFGIGSYMVLNEPEFISVPPWLTDEVWFVVSMVSILMIGLLLFYTAITSQDIDWPWEAVPHLYEKVQNRRR